MMAIFLDRYCLQQLIDVIEGKIILSDEERENLVSLHRRKIQIERDREEGKNLGGRPRKKPFIITMFDK